MQSRNPTQGVDNRLIVVDDGVEFETVWSGADELLPPRSTKPDLTWEPPRRLYNKRADAKAPTVVVGEHSATIMVEETK